MNVQRRQNDFLLTVAKSIFQDIVSMDTVIMKIMVRRYWVIEMINNMLLELRSKTGARRKGIAVPCRCKG
jgi:hypothetical protein